MATVTQKRKAKLYPFMAMLPKKDFLQLENYVKSLGGIVKKEPQVKTWEDEILAEYEQGNFVHCGTIEEFEKKIEKYFK